MHIHQCCPGIRGSIFHGSNQNTTPDQNYVIQNKFKNFQFKM